MDAIQEIKNKAIKDFLYLLHRLNLGYLDSYDYILNEITFIEAGSMISSPTHIFEYLLNHNIHNQTLSEVLNK